MGFDWSQSPQLSVEDVCPCQLIGPLRSSAVVCSLFYFCKKSKAVGVESLQGNNFPRRGSLGIFRLDKEGPRESFVLLRGPRDP